MPGALFGEGRGHPCRLQAGAAIRDRLLAVEVAQQKKDFGRATDAEGQPINDVQVINAELQLVPTAAAREALEADYRAMTDSGMLDRIALLEQLGHAIARFVS